ncbi:MAG: heme exporter protein CcmD [Sulfitobacter sp.]|jgi:heme exporter protein CcmD
MPDLGSYSVYVLSAYGVSLSLLVLLVLSTLRQSAQVRAELAVIEARREDRREARNNG